MNAALPHLQQITLAGMRVAELSREIRRRLAIGDGPAIARDAATLATVSERILRAESAVRAELQRHRHCPFCDSPEHVVTGHCATCDRETEVVS